VGGKTTTSRSGSFERPMHLETLARAAGAAFYARATVNHTAALVKLIERALAVPGFALVEVVSNCHVLFGRMNDLGDAADMMKGMDRQTRRVNPVLIKRAAMPHRVGGDDSGTGAPVPEDDPRLPRGVIFERKGGEDYAHRYYDSIEEAVT
jgi:pyruvate/2-oxoacid:ferredoxin oxidoreductase beta subunit